jgi:hypothetical protein
MQRVAGFVVVTGALLVASDFAPTAPLAVAFAWLIFLSSALIVGPAAFANVQASLGVGTPTKAA